MSQVAQRLTGPASRGQNVSGNAYARKLLRMWLGSLAHWQRA